jgi:nicotinate-nucleotide--dimethylbenzimidazole phosphoribosyltransferase
MNALLDAIVAVGIPLAPGDRWRLGERLSLTECGPEALGTAVARVGGDARRVLAVGADRTAEDAAQAAGTNYMNITLGAGVSAAVDEWVRTYAGRRFAKASAAVVPVDERAAADASAHYDRLTKPAGSLGRLEAVGARIAAIAGTCPPPALGPATVAVFVGDHGVVDEGVTPWPPEVTRHMVSVFAQGKGAVNVFARSVGADVVVVDVGMAGRPATGPRLIARNVRRGAGNLALGPALRRTDVQLALDVGTEVAQRCIADGAQCLITGDMGIGNTTPSAAVIAALTGRPAGEVTGRGTGIDDAMFAHKTGIIERAVARLDGRDPEPAAVLAEVGGLEIAALAGFIVGGAASRVPVLVDGVAATAALAAAAAMVPASLGYVLAGHRSAEPGATAVLEHLGLEPLLDLGMRLGEGTGAVLALPLVRAAVDALHGMATLADIGILPPTQESPEITEFRDAASP